MVDLLHVSHLIAFDNLDRSHRAFHLGPQAEFAVFTRYPMFALCLFEYAAERVPVEGHSDGVVVGLYQFSVGAVCVGFPASIAVNDFGDTTRLVIGVFAVALIGAVDAVQRGPLRHECICAATRQSRSPCRPLLSGPVQSGRRIRAR